MRMSRPELPCAVNSFRLHLLVSLNSLHGICFGRRSQPKNAKGSLLVKVMCMSRPQLLCGIPVHSFRLRLLVSLNSLHGICFSVAKSFFGCENQEVGHFRDSVGIRRIVISGMGPYSLLCYVYEVVGLVPRFSDFWPMSRRDETPMWVTVPPGNSARRISSWTHQSHELIHTLNPKVSARLHRICWNPHEHKRVEQQRFNEHAFTQPGAVVTPTGTAIRYMYRKL